MKKSIFFAAEGQKGLNSTSAQFLCALASQLKSQAEQALNNISFVTTKVDIVGAESPEKITSLGINDSQFDQISANIKLCADMNRLISWYSEARKALEEVKRESERMDFQDFLKNVLGVERPIAPDYPEDPKSPTLQDAINLLSIKDREQYLALEARAAVLGKFIHVDNPMEKARERMHKALTEPYSTSGNGRDTLIMHYEPSIDPEKVDQKFVALQQEYRSVEQSLNHMKHELMDKLAQMKVEVEATRRIQLLEYENKYNDWKVVQSKYVSQYNEWKAAEEQRLSKIKFVIPDALKDTVDYLNNLAK